MISMEAELREWFGHAAFRDGQAATIDAVCEGRDCLSILPTSAGKSLTYQLPGLVLRAVAPDAVVLVVSPLISLLTDQVDGLNRRFALSADGRPRRLRPGEGGSPVAALVGSAQPDRMVEARAAAGAFAFVFLCPESVERYLSLAGGGGGIQLIVVDEAHCVAAHGFDFRPSYRELGRLRERWPSVPLLALTATANESVAGDVVSSLGFRADHVCVRTSANRKNLYYEVRRKDTVGADCVRMASMIRATPGQTFLYVLTRKETISLAQRLSSLGVNAASYHAGLEDRALALKRFLRGDVQVMVCTIACGMGIDHQGVSLVVHYGLPRDLSAYAQESGRAGRSGALSRCVLFAGAADSAMQHRFLDTTDEAQRARKRRSIRGMAAYVEATACRRRLLLREFGETLPPGPCLLSDGTPGCDRCVARPEHVLVDCTDEARPLLQGIRTLRCTGASRLVDFCVGSKAKHVKGVAGRVGYGALSAYPKARVKGVLAALREAAFVQTELSNQGFPLLSLSTKGNECLAALGRVQLPVSPRSNKRKRAVRPSAVAARDAPRYERLRQWRRATAAAEGRPVWMVASNAALASLASARPGTLDALRRLDGIGDAKVRKYGEALLRCVREEDALHRMQLPAQEAGIEF